MISGLGARPSGLRGAQRPSCWSPQKAILSQPLLLCRAGSPRRRRTSWPTWSGVPTQWSRARPSTRFGARATVKPAGTRSGADRPVPAATPRQLQPTRLDSDPWPVTGQDRNRGVDRGADGPYGGNGGADASQLGGPLPRDDDEDVPRHDRLGVDSRTGAWPGRRPRRARRYSPLVRRTHQATRATSPDIAMIVGPVGRSKGIESENPTTDARTADAIE